MAGADTAVEIKMPELSGDASSAALASWLVEVGDRVEKGEVIAELETDKSTVEFESPVAGRILELLVAAGSEDVETGTVLARISVDGTGAAASVEPAAADPTPEEVTKPAAEAGAEESARAADGPEPAGPVAPARAMETDRPVTPLARRLAEREGVDLGAVEGSGARGRITKTDVLRAGGAPSPVAAEARAPSAPPVEVDLDDSIPHQDTRLSSMRRTIARRLTESKQNVPHFYLRARCRMDRLLEVRAGLNADLATTDAPIKISVNDFVVRAVALALMEVPEANVSFVGDAMRQYARADVSVAVATEGGLVTPVVRGANGKGLVALASEIRELAAKARDGKLRPDEYRGGTISVSNLGMYGIDTVYPILNPPQACILGVGAADEVPVVIDGAVGIGHVANLTLAADHRAVDGAVGARLLATIKSNLEDPVRMVL